MTINQTTEEIQDFIKKNNDFSKIEEKNINQIYQKLVDNLTDHNHLYHIENKPIISDLEYDELFLYLKNIENNFSHLISVNSPTQNIFGQISDGFEQAKHTTRLFSLENTYNAEDIQERKKRSKKELKKRWIDNNLYISYSVEPKFDGIWIELLYKNGKLEKVITRWDGIYWEDITNNAKMINSIPKELKLGDFPELKKATISVRWEIMMSKPSREKLNKQREKENKNIFANTRNAAAGSVKLLDPNEVKKRSLVCFVYNLLYSNKEEIIWKTQEETIKTFKKLGLPILNRLHICKNINEVINLCKENTRDNLQQKVYDFDGLVIKINENKNRKLLGATDHHPRRAIAYKFPAKQVSTQITSIDFQVGRTGIITPVANLKPTKLSGATISRVSLHNFDFIKNKDIRNKDYVWIQRSGEVIPYIVWVIKERRKWMNPIMPPTQCPICQKETSQVNMHYYCTNLECDAQIKEKIIHFVSKNALNIEGIWESIIDILVDQRIIKNFADLYKLTEQQTKFRLSSLPGFWDKKISEISKQLEASKKQSLRRLINALGIPGIWKKIAKTLAEELIKESKKTNTKNNLKFIKKKINQENFLKSIYGIWEKIIDWIINYFQINNKNLEELEKMWLNFSKNNNWNNSWILSKQHFTITWSFPFSREKIIQILESNWANFDNTPTQKTNFILIWESPWGKAEKAKKLKIPSYIWRNNIINKYEFLKNLKKEKKKDELPTMQSLF